MAKLKRKNCHCCQGSGKEFDHELVGDYLRTQRERLKISAAKVARFMDISKPYLCDLEYGRRNWRSELIEKYRAAIGIT
jgi:predicted transcriptional regulator